MKETGRKLTTICTDQSTSLAQVKELIVAKNKGVMVKNLYIKEQQCVSRVIKLINDGQEWRVDEKR